MSPISSTNGVAVEYQGTRTQCRKQIEIALPYIGFEVPQSYIFEKGFMNE